MSALCRCARLAARASRPLSSPFKTVTTNSVSSHNTVCSSWQNKLCYVNACHISGVKAYSTQAEVTQTDTSSFRPVASKYPSDFPVSDYWRDFEFITKKSLEEILDQQRAASGRQLSLPMFYCIMRKTQEKESLTLEEAVSVLDCLCCAPLRISPEERIKWLKYLDNRFRELGVERDIRYHNKVLTVYLNNGYDFSVVEYLSQMEKDGCIPNRITLVRCLSRYCRSGEMQSASEILEHMKTCEMPITSKTYSMVILGHFKAGNVDTANTLFKGTQQMGFERDVTLYHTMILGNTLVENMDTVKQLFDEASEEGCVLSGWNLSNMIEFAVENNKPQFVEYFQSKLEQISSQSQYDGGNEAILTNLLRKGHYDVAYKCFKALSVPSWQLYTAMACSNMHFKEVAKILRQMKTDGLAENPFTEFIGDGVKLNPEQSVGVLRFVSKEGEEMRPQMIYPFVRYYRVMGDLEGLKKNVLPYLPVYEETFTKFLNPDLMPMIEKNLDIFEQILKENTKLTEGQRNCCVVYEILFGKGLEAAAEAATKISEFSLISSWEQNHGNMFFYHLYRETKNPNGLWKEAITLATAIDLPVLPFLNNIVKHAGMTEEGMVEIKDHVIKAGVNGISKNNLESLGLAEKMTPQELKTITTWKSINFHDMTYEELKEKEPLYAGRHVYNIHMITTPRTRKDLPFFKRCLERLEKQARGIYSGRLLFQFVTFYINEEPNPEKAYQLLKAGIKNNDGKQIIKMNVVQQVASLLWKQGSYEEAIDLMSTYAENRPTDFKDKGIIEARSYFTDMERTVTNGELAFRFMNQCIQSEYYPHALESLSEGFWNFILSIEDFDLILRCSDILDFKLIHRLDLVGAFLLYLDDRKKVEILYEKFQTKCHSSHPVLLAFGTAWLESGDENKFIKLIQTSGMKLDSMDVNPMCLRWHALKKYEMADKFLELTKDIPGTFRYNINTLKLWQMCSEEDPDVDACIKFFDENLGMDGSTLPMKKTLKYFANFLQKHNRPVPFEDMLKMSHIDLRQELRHRMQRKMQNEETELDDEVSTEQGVEINSLLHKLKKEQ